VVDETDPRAEDFAFSQDWRFNLPMKSFLVGSMTFKRLEEAKPVDTTPRRQDTPSPIANDEDASWYRDICWCSVSDVKVSARHHERHVTALAHMPPQGMRAGVFDR
jgi:hypothetical protein